MCTMLGKNHEQKAMGRPHLFKENEKAMGNVDTSTEKLMKRKFEWLGKCLIVGL